MMTNSEPIILVFEGASRNTLEVLKIELKRIFRGTRFEDHFMVVNQVVRGVENSYEDKIDTMIKLLERIEDNQ